MSPAPTVRFVSHEATRTGAPIALLRFQRWLREHSDVAFETVCLAGGPLLEELAELGPTRLGDTVAAASPPLPEVVYLNSAASLPVVGHLQPGGPRVVGYIHELELGQRLSLAGHDAAGLFKRVDDVIVVADCVADSLVEQWGVSRDRIRQVPPPVTSVDAEPARSSPAGWAALGIEPDALVVGGAGSIGWRKGTDLFVELIRRLVECEGGRPVHGVWVGAGQEHPDFSPVAFDVAHAGLGHRLRFVGEQEQPAGWFRRFDVLALTSREDPFPLVVGECATVGVPTVGFDASGGVPELIDRGRPAEIGWTVPYLDLGVMASLIDKLLDDPGRRQAAAGAAASVVRAELDVDVVGPQLAEVLRVPSRSSR